MSAIEEPLIFTTKGNLPIAMLEYRHGWFESETDISFIEEYWLGDELVKRNVHARLKQGLGVPVEQVQFG